DEGIVGVAARLVRCLDKRYEPLIDTLLGRVIVCTDLPAAHRMVGRGLGSVVTLDGTFLERHGEVSGGDHLAEAGLFASQREMDELPPKIEEARKKAEQLQGQLNEGRASMEQVRARAEAAEVEYESARRDGDRLRGELTREQQRLLGLRRE